MKNLPNQLKRDLKQLRAIKPDAAWLAQNKQALLATLPVAESAQRPLSYRSVVSISFKQVLAKLAWQPIGITLMVLGIIGGPSLAAVNAAKGSLPGDALYPVKRSLEKARVSITFSQAKKAQLEVDLVANRLHELQRLTKEQAPSPARQQKITIAIEELKKDTAAVKTRLDSTKQDGKTSQETVALAKIIDAKTSGYQESLQQAIDELDPETAKTNATTLTQAVSTVQDVSINALDVLVSDASKSENALSPEDLQGRVAKQLDVVKKAATALQTQVAAFQPAPEQKEEAAPAANKGETKETDTAATPSTTEVKAEPVQSQPEKVEAPAITADETEKETEPATQEPVTNPEPTPEPVTKEGLQKQIESDVLPLIIYAEELIKLKDFTAALETLNKANKKIEELSTALDALQDTVQTEPPVEIPAEDPATEPSGEKAPAEGDAKPEGESQTEGESKPAEAPAEPTKPAAQTSTTNTNTNNQ